MSEYDPLIAAARQARENAHAKFGPGGRTLFILARGAEDSTGQQIANAAQVYSIQMIARGPSSRPK